MRQWRQIPTRADRALGWNDRMHAVVEQRDQQLDQLVADAAQSLGEDVGAQQQHGAHFRLFQRLAQSAGVAAHQVALQLLQVTRADAHVG